MDTPETQPEQAGPRIVAIFLAEFIPSVHGVYELLEKAAISPLKISLPELQMEVLAFGLHCLDRAVFTHWGAEYRAVFMDSAFSKTRELFATVLPECAREQFLKSLDELYNTRQVEYTGMKLFPGNDGELKGVLFWEYAKRICLDAGVQNPIALKAIFDEAMSISTMMNKIVPTL